MLRRGGDKAWKTRAHTDLHSLRVLLGKLMNVSQCCHPVRHFLNHMLNTLKACIAAGTIPLMLEFRKDRSRFDQFLPETNGVYIIHEEKHTPLGLHIDMCITRAGTVLEDEAYHSTFPDHILHETISYVTWKPAVAAIISHAPGLQNCKGSYCTYSVTT